MYAAAPFIYSRNWWPEDTDFKLDTYYGLDKSTLWANQKIASIDIYNDKILYNKTILSGYLFSPIDSVIKIYIDHDL